MRGEGDSLKDNFSYFDMLAYLAPGFVLLWAGQQGLHFVGLSTYFQMENWAFGSLVGLVLAYVLGQLVSARGSVRFEIREAGGQRTVFRHGRISENFLLQGRSVYGKVLCKEPRRLTLVEMAKKHCDLSVLEAEHLDKWKENLDAAQETSHEVYRPLLTLLTDEKIGEKAMTMSLRYMFFRNLNVAAAYGASLFLLSACYNFMVGLPLVDPRIVLPIILALLFAVTSLVARQQALYAAINHVREVFDSAYHFYAARSRTEKAT
jgi:hypothetical protein